MLWGGWYEEIGLFGSDWPDDEPRTLAWYEAMEERAAADGLSLTRATFATEGEFFTPVVLLRRPDGSDYDWWRTEGTPRFWRGAEYCWEYLWPEIQRDWGDRVASAAAPTATV